MPLQNRYSFVFKGIAETCYFAYLSILRAVTPLPCLQFTRLALARPAFFAVSMQYYSWRDTISPQLDLVFFRWFQALPAGSRKENGFQLRWLLQN
jgi:hypothetical protein